MDREDHVTSDATKLDGVGTCLSKPSTRGANLVVSRPLSDRQPCLRKVCKLGSTPQNFHTQLARAPILTFAVECYCTCRFLGLARFAGTWLLRIFVPPRMRAALRCAEGAPCVHDPKWVPTTSPGRFLRRDEIVLPSLHYARTISEPVAGNF